MEDTQVMIHVIVQEAIEATRAAVKAMTEAAGTTEVSSGTDVATSMSARARGQSLKQPSFNWKGQDKCQ